LTNLNCYRNLLTSLDVSKNTALTVLNCGINQLKNLDVSKNTALTELSCIFDNLTTLDVSKNTALMVLSCAANLLTTIDVSKNIALTELICGGQGNPMTSLNVTKNTALRKLNCQWSELTELDVSKNTALERLICGHNQLTSLDVSKNTALTELDCYDNQLTSLDVSKNTALQQLWAQDNQLASLNVSGFTALTSLQCDNNKLTSLDVSGCTALERISCHENHLTTLNVSGCKALDNLVCFNNRIRGAAMDALIAGLKNTGGSIYAIDDGNNEQNVVTKAQVADAKAKDWTVYDSHGNEYEGCDEQTISPVDEGEVINIGDEIDENTSLDGNVVDNVYFNINDGSYSASEGCIVVNSPTDDSFINGQDIFGDDFKEGYNGIVFMVPAGEGTINVEAETTGDMVLKVKIGNKKPITMVLNGKLTISFPYDVTEDTYVYIYGGTSSAGAKGMSRAAGSGSLKIYGIEVVGGENGIEAIDNGQLTIDDSPVYNLNGQRVISSPSGRPGGVPTKGVFIRNGKKVLVK
ncbi:MAG: leucine-rich repeat domain-containing protein, partial [Prevotella sp.]|nr:leucine-rich repeat domain-containing protein [Prevotella sp.]